MKLDYNEQELYDLMKDFHLLTGIRIVLFDRDYSEVLSFPKNHCRFCDMMKNRSDTHLLCDQSDQTSFRQCQKENKLIIYHCHAGLIEAAAPLIDQGIVIGYMMFGQISDEQNVENLVSVLLQNNHLSKEDIGKIFQYTEDIPLKTNEQIHAAAKIMEACTFYVIFKNTIRVRRDNFMHNMDKYLLEHLSEDLSVNSLANAFGISKTKLYETCSMYYGCGIAEHIRYLRIEKAKSLLKETNLPITTVSDEVGFTDYNYFCRVFKKQVGLPAKKYRVKNA